MEPDAVELIGREAELRRLTAFVERVRDGPGAVVIEGEAGIGKTTLWEAGAAKARRHGVTVLRTRPAEAETSFALVGVADLLDGVLDDVAADLPPPQLHALRAAMLLEDSAAVDRRAVATAVLSSLRSLADDGLAVCVDDVQWLDASSARALAFAARRLGDEPVSFLLSRRITAKGGPTTVEEALGPRLERIRLEPLDLDALSDLVRTRVGQLLPRPLLKRIHARSGGNPFFALELVRALEDGGEDQLPDSLDALLRSRLDGLPAATRTALTAAAAAARPTVALLDATLEHEARATLATAIDVGVVAVDTRGAIVFDHPLLASAALSLSPPSETRALHRKLAAAVAEPEERARHLALAAEGPDAAIAQALDGAARRAAERGAPADAADLAERAAALTPASDAKAFRGRLLDAAFFHFESGDARSARAHVDEVLAATAAGERGRALRLLAQIRSYDDDLAAAHELFLAAIDEAGEADLETAAIAHEGAASTLFRLRTSFTKAAEHARHSVVLAERIGDRALRASAIATQLVCEATLGLTQAERTLALARAANDDATGRAVGRPLFTTGVADMWAERLDDARAEFTELLALAQAIGDESSLPYIHVLLAQNECFAGELEQGLAHAREAARLADQAGMETMTAYGLSIAAFAEAHRGADEARALAADALDRARRTAGAPATQFATAALGLLELSLGRFESAHEALEPLVRWARTEHMCEPGLTRFARDDTESLIALGRLEEAEELLDWWGGHAERLGRRGAIADALRARALLLAAQGSGVEAVDLLARAVDAPLPFARARSLLAYGAMLRRGKRKSDARAALEEAAAEFDRMGARVFAANARTELAAIGGRTSSTGELTPTEARVVELVAAGRTNKEVAAALFLATKTVEFHLRNVFRKLDVRSRTELAARYRPRG